MRAGLGLADNARASRAGRYWLVSSGRQLGSGAGGQACMAVAEQPVLCPLLPLPPLLPPLLPLLIVSAVSPHCLAGVFRSDLPCKFRCKPEAYQVSGGRVWFGVICVGCNAHLQLCTCPHVKGAQGSVHLFASWWPVQAASVCPLLRTVHLTRPDLPTCCPSVHRS